MRTQWKNSHRRDIITFCLTYIPLGDVCLVDAHALAASPAPVYSPEPGSRAQWRWAHRSSFRRIRDSSLGVLADSCKSLPAVSNPGHGDGVGTPPAPGRWRGQLLLCPGEVGWPESGVPGVGCAPRAARLPVPFRLSVLRVRVLDPEGQEQTVLGS